jgi:hypothetical protein
MDEVYLGPERAQTQLFLFDRKEKKIGGASVMDGYNHPLQH